MSSEQYESDLPQLKELLYLLDFTVQLGGRYYKTYTGWSLVMFPHCMQLVYILDFTGASYHKMYTGWSSVILSTVVYVLCNLFVYWRHTL